MKLEINNEKVNRLLHRTELDCTITFVGATPTKKEITKEIATKKHAEEKRTIVDSIKQEYGKKEASFFAKIYESENSLEKVEGKQKKEEEPAKEKEEETSTEQKETPAEPEKKAEEKPEEKKE